MKKIYLKAFEVKPSQESPGNIDFMKILNEALSSKPTLLDRVMDLSQMDPSGEEECITNYSLSRGVLSGTLIRLKRGAIGQVTKEQLGEKTLELGKIVSHAEESVRGSIIGYAYFGMNENHLVYFGSTLRHKAIETHLNWLIHEDNPNKEHLELNPILSSAHGITMSQVKSIRVDGSALAGIPEYENIARDIGSLKSEVLRLVLQDTKSLDDFEAEDIVSASIVLRVRSRKHNDAEREAALKALLRSTDGDSIIVSTKDKKTIRGDFFEEKKEIDIDTTTAGYPVEVTLFSELRNYLQEVGAHEAPR